MIVVIAKWILLLFGLFIVVAGFVMLFAPKRARSTLRKAGSTNFINYAEITIRLLPAIALVLYSDSAKFPEVFKVFGWIMIVTSIILYVVPRRIHHAFSKKSADILKPVYFRLISPLAFLLGGLLIYYTL